MIVLRCKACRYYLVVVEGDLPKVCPNRHCRKEADWEGSTFTPNRAVTLTQSDRRFLKSLRITQEDPDGRADEFR